MQRYLVIDLSFVPFVSLTHFPGRVGVLLARILARKAETKLDMKKSAETRAAGAAEVQKTATAKQAHIDSLPKTKKGNLDMRFKVRARLVARECGCVCERVGARMLHVG